MLLCRCVTMVHVSTPAPPSLFSAPAATVFRPARALDEDTELVVEAEVDAIVKLGMFIGDKVRRYSVTTEFSNLDIDICIVKR